MQTLFMLVIGGIFLLVQKTIFSFNPLNPNIKIEILICYLDTFSVEVVGRIC